MSISDISCMSATGHALESCVAVPYLACVKRQHYPSPTSPRDPAEIKLPVAHRGKTENRLLSVAMFSLSQADHGFMAVWRMVHEEMSFGSFPLAELMDLNTWGHTANGTGVEEFILLGFPGAWHSQVSLGIVFALTYSLTLIGNASFIVLVWMNSSLHTPMYFFLCNLSFLEIRYTVGIVPKAIGVMLGTSQTISFSVCILQLFFLLPLGSTECFLLSVMAYDRSSAICYPLRYSSLMNSVLSSQLVLSSWLGGFLAISLLAFLTSRLTFCGPDVINHFLCNIDSCLALSCSDTWPVELVTFLVSIIVVVASCVVTLISYVYITSSMLRLQSAHGQKKDFSICSAHLSVVTIWYDSTVFLYVKPSAENSLDLNKHVITSHTVVTPLLNPFIYTLRNKEVKQALGWAFQKK
ncbi:LOW QUALITY PROTEIN: olfactory receptor 6F1-like [Gymnogyps californianus]|uniref:LOW QUALITY PROTEIN: olfactory receptor 6F1-like n=1 Tax=Gymnogyps californianus TaxID=33616 RepID=UPI0021C91B7C|nr:LOW QUALITY PROTEIN: olfactory receptor 6F1-like [Gymnogyps californianus]